MYANSIDLAKTTLLDRTELMNAWYGSPDGDPEPWTPSDITGPGAQTHAGQVYGIQAPFTGDMEYPPDGRCWAAERARMKAMAEAWGSTYVSKDIGDGKAPVFMINGPLAAAKERAEQIMAAGNWPVGYWRDNGYGAFRVKKYLKAVRQGVAGMCSPKTPTRRRSRKRRSSARAVGVLPRAGTTQRTSHAPPAGTSSTRSVAPPTGST